MSAEGDGSAFGTAVAAARVEQHAPVRHVDAAHLREQHLDVPLSSKNPANRRCDIARRQRRRGDLVEERLEKVVVMAIDERHAHGRAGERARSVEPTESAAQNDDMRQRRH